MQVTHAGIAEVGDEAFKPSEWRGCIKAGNYLRLPLCFLLGYCELAVHRWSRVCSYTSSRTRLGLLTDGLVGSSIRTYL